MQATFTPYELHFKQASGTSRGILRTKDTWIIKLSHQGKIGYGECGMFKGLSYDDHPNYQSKLEWACKHIHLGLEELLHELSEFPSIQFGFEMAFKSLESVDCFELFPSQFTAGNNHIPINGLIWMGDKSFMKSQIKEKLYSGFDCIKMKIGAIDFNSELELLKSIRKEFSADDVELRVDANGAFDPLQALEKLKRLSDIDLHSIEQPIKQGQWQAMAELCAKTPLPIALDEELIGITSVTQKKELLHTIEPQYIILKPTLIGGFNGSEEWIDYANNQEIGWWVTSALESNVGLNAIAQWTYQLKNDMPQGLGTGSLFANNFDSPLIVKNGTLRYDTDRDWNHLQLPI